MSAERVKLVYSSIGNKNSEITLIFLHGSSMTKEGMMPVAEGFIQYNCIVFDLTAHGESLGEEPAEIKTFAEDVENSILQLQRNNIIGKKIVLLGYSMGGAITCEIALRKRIKLSGIVLLSSGADLNSYTPLVDDLKAMPIDNFVVADVFPALFGIDTPEINKKIITEHFNSTKVSDEISYRDLMVSNGYNHLQECKNIDIPALLVQGSDDKIVLPMAAVATWKEIQNSELLMVPYKGHALIFEDKELITGKILSFIEKL